MSARQIDVTVIIPVFNQSATIRRTLEGFKKQAGAAVNAELILVDDRSSDNSVELIRHFVDAQCILLVNQVNSGPAFTRNRGLDAARGRIIVFSDGDIVPDAGFLKAHMDFHAAYPGDEYAALGNVVHPLDIKLTPLQLLGNAVDKWNEKQCAHHQPCSGLDLRTGNFSLKKKFLGTDRFNQELFPRMGFEDTELGYRLSARGMKILFNAQALSYHYHFREPGEYLTKVVSYGEALARWTKNCPPAMAAELNEKYNSMYDPSAWISKRNMNEFLRRVCINDLTVPFVKGLAGILGPVNQRLSAYFYNKLFKYLLLKGYRAELAREDRQVASVVKVKRSTLNDLRVVL